MKEAAGDLNVSIDMSVLAIGELPGQRRSFDHVTGEGDARDLNFFVGFGEVLINEIPKQRGCFFRGERAGKTREG